MQIISQVMKECFQLCANYGCSCIAFPPLGVGRLYQYQPSVVAEGMVDCILRETQSGSLKVRFRYCWIILYLSSQSVLVNRLVGLSLPRNSVNG